MACKLRKEEKNRSDFFLSGKNRRRNRRESRDFGALKRGIVRHLGPKLQGPILELRQLSLVNSSNPNRCFRSDIGSIAFSITVQVTPSFLAETRSFKTANTESRHLSSHQLYACCFVGLHFSSPMKRNNVSWPVSAYFQVSCPFFGLSLALVCPCLAC